MKWDDDRDFFTEDYDDPTVEWPEEGDSRPKRQPRRVADDAWADEFDDENGVSEAENVWVAEGESGGLGDDLWGSDTDDRGGSERGIWRWVALLIGAILGCATYLYFSRQ